MTGWVLAESPPTEMGSLTVLTLKNRSKTPLALRNCFMLVGHFSLEVQHACSSPTFVGALVRYYTAVCIPVRVGVLVASVGHVLLFLHVGPEDLPVESGILYLHLDNSPRGLEGKRGRRPLVTLVSDTRGIFP